MKIQKVNDARVYTHKFPKHLRKSMKKFTESECLLVNRRQKGKTADNTAHMCHENVQHWVDRVGGESKNGWLLGSTNKMKRLGVWTFVFHSIWETPEGKLVDVTTNKVYRDKPFVTFWQDRKRNVDMEAGISYNSIIAVSDKFLAAAMSRAYQFKFEINQLYWHAERTNVFIPVSQNSGEFRQLNDGKYPENHKLLEEKYGVSAKDNSLIGDKMIPAEVAMQMCFEFNMSLGTVSNSIGLTV